MGYIFAREYYLAMSMRRIMNTRNDTDRCQIITLKKEARHKKVHTIPVHGYEIL